MKKNFFSKITTSIFLISALIFVSCTGLSENYNYDIEEMATVSIAIAETETDARTIKPITKLSDISDLELKGTKNGGSQETLGTWSNYSALSSASIKIPAGSWTFVFTCKKGNESFSGNATANITSGTTTRLSFILEHVTSSSTPSTGTASGTIQYPQGLSVQTAMINIKNSSNTDVYTLVKQADEIQNNSITFNASNLAPGTYQYQVALFKTATTLADYNSFMQSLQTMTGEQIRQWRTSRLIETFNIPFVIEAGLTTDLSQNFSYLDAPVTTPGFKSVRALTDSDGKGYIEFVVKWPDRITYDENGSSVTRNVQAIEISREGGSGISFDVGAYDNQNGHPSTVVLCDRYELTQGQQYNYTLRYNWQWQEATEFTTTVTASANSFGTPTIVCPTTTFNGTTLTCTNLNESDLNLNNCTTQAERNRITDISISFNYYDENQPNDWGSTRVYSGFSYRNNTPKYLWSTNNSGVTRKLYYAAVTIKCGKINRTFQVPDDQLQSWAAGKLATTLQFATSGN